MKRINLIIVFAVLMFSAASAQKKSSKEISKAVDNAAIIAFDLDPAEAIRLEKPALVCFHDDNGSYSYLSVLKKVVSGSLIYTKLGGGYLTGSDEKDNYGYIVGSGTNSFLVQPISAENQGMGVWISKKQFKNNVTPVSFDFEEGKCYFLRFKQGKGKDKKFDFFIEEMAGKNMPLWIKIAKEKLEQFDVKEQIEKRKAFEAYTAEHPNRFDGTWNGKGGSTWAKYSSIRYTFDGNKMKYEVSTNQYGGLALTVEGRILYNDEILVLLPEKVYDEGGEEIDYISMMPYVWYYTLTGNELNLVEGNRDFLSGLWKIGGKYTKTE